MALKWAFVCICICYFHGQSFAHKVKKRNLNSWDRQSIAVVQITETLE